MKQEVHGMTRKYPSESDEQIGFLQWFERMFQGVRIFHIPNGGHRAISVAKKMKAEGVKPGVPDFYVPEWKLWIEMKRQKGGSVSADQRDWIAYLEAIGDQVIIGKGATDASRQVLVFLQARAGARIAPKKDQPPAPVRSKAHVPPASLGSE